MVYHQVTLGPSDAQMASLAEGDPTHLPAKNFKGDIPFHLTTAQLRKIEKAHAAGKGCLLKLSSAQVKMMAQKGSGRFTDMLRKGYDMAKPVLRAGLKKGIAYGASKLEQGISDAAHLDGEGFFGNLAKKAAHAGIDFVADRVGAGVGHHHHHHHQAGGWVGSDIFGGKVKPGKKGQRGKGFFGDLAKSAAHAGVDYVVDKSGAGLPNPRANPNEGLRAALFQKKVGSMGKGLYLS